MNPRPRFAGNLTLPRPERMILQMYGEVARPDWRRGSASILN